MAIRGLEIVHHTGDTTYLETDVALRQAMQDPTKFGDIALVASFLRERHLDLPEGMDPNQPVISASMLFGFSRLNITRALVDYYEEPEAAYAKVRGTILHAAMENVPLPAWAEERIVKEQRMWVELQDPMNPGDSMWLSGQLDMYVDPRPEASPYILDYKSSRSDRLPTKPHESHVGQANTYALMWRELYPDKPVGRLFIQYRNYKAYRTLEVPLWDTEEAYQLITARAFWMRDLLRERVLPSRGQACKVHVEKYFCPFYEWCQNHYDATRLPDADMVWGEGKMWAKAEWNDRRFAQATKEPRKRTEWKEEV